MIQFLQTIAIILVAIVITFMIVGWIDYSNPKKYYTIQPFIYISIFKFVRLMINHNIRKYIKFENSGIAKHFILEYNDYKYSLFFRHFEYSIFFVFYFIRLIYSDIKEKYRMIKDKEINDSIRINTKMFNTIIRMIKKEEY